MAHQGRTSEASLGVAPSKVLGSQVPRICTYPAYTSSLGDKAIKLCKSVGLNLDPWQRLVLQHALGIGPDGKFAAFSVGCCATRQNGKSELLVARILAGLFLPELNEELILFSAHQFDTAMEIFRRLVFIVENSKLVDEVKLNRGQVGQYSHGNEGITLKSGQRVRFKARTSGGARGFVADCIMFDEAMILRDDMIGAVLPTLSARPNPQVWYSGSSVDQEVHQDGLVFSRVREHGIDESDDSLAYFEWSVDADDPAHVPAEILNDPTQWAIANPALNLRIAESHVIRERSSMAPRTFATERLGVGDWCPTDRSDVQPISLETWNSLTEYGSVINDPVAFAFDVTPDRRRACIAACGNNPNSFSHVEVVEHGDGTEWLAKRLSELVRAHRTSVVVYDPAGPANSIVPDLEDVGAELIAVTAREHAQACGMLFDAVEQADLRHLGDERLSAALSGATKRPLVDSWAWSRRDSTVDISPLVAITLALWGHKVHGTESIGVWNIAEMMHQAQQAQQALQAA